MQNNGINYDLVVPNSKKTNIKQRIQALKNRKDKLKEEKQSK